LSLCNAYCLTANFFQTADCHTKLDSVVSFPITGLDLSCYLKQEGDAKDTINSEEYLYDLNAVCNHFGNMECGHYTGKYSQISNAFSVTLCGV
jgi:Ubiquitin carboxyl-terminal hydrolase